MKNIKIPIFFIFLIFIINIIFLNFTFATPQFIEIIKNKVNLRIGPSISETIIVQSKKGDIFEVKGETEKWYKINMFSGEYRYVNKSMAIPTTYTISLPSTSICQNVFHLLEEAEDRALDEANKKYPLDIYKNIDYERLLVDKYKLIIFHNFNIQPPIYIKLIVKIIEG
jgi:SH3-like domain-containing protein